MTGRVARLATPVVAVAVLGGLTVGLARSTAGATFTTATADTGNKVTSATNFCVSPGSTTTVTPPQDDALVDQADPDTSHYTGKLSVQTGSGAAQRTFVRFTDPADSLPTAPHDCTLASATLRLYDGTPSGTTRTVDVYRLTPQSQSSAWSSQTITWNNMPTATTGTAVGSTTPGSAGWQTWTVTSFVQAMYTYGVHGGDNGFMFRDHNENTGTAYQQVYDDLLASHPAELVLTWQ